MTAPARHRPTLILLLNSLSIGGAERHTLALAHELGDSFDVIVAHLKPTPAGATALQAGGLRTVHLGVQRRFDRRAAGRLAQLIEASGAQTLACVNTYPLLYAHWARRLATQPLRIVEIFHTTALWTWRGRLEMAFYWPLFRMADDLVFLCDAQRRHWQARGIRAARTCRIYNGVDTVRFDPAPFAEAGQRLRRQLGWAPQDRVVGLCAVLRPEKAHGLLMQSVAQLAQEGQRWRVLLIGDGPLRTAIEAQVQALGLQDQVHITGLQADVRPALAACDVVTLVSVSETFSMAALEAMAMGKPMVMSDVGGAREQLTDGEDGLLFPAGDRAALTAALRRCWEPAETLRMGAAARRKVLAQFSQAAMAAAYRALLQAPLRAELKDQPVAGRVH
ncbi:MAG: glycosyltransferase [Pseudomonadota bacterium]